MHTLHTRGAVHKHAPARTHMHIHAQAGAAPTHRLGAVCMPAETRTRSALHLTHRLVVELTPRHKRAHRLRSGSHTHARIHKHSLGFSHTQVQCGSQGHSDRATLRRGCRTPLCSHGALTRCTQHLHASASPLPRAHPTPRGGRDHAPRGVLITHTQRPNALHTLNSFFAWPCTILPCSAPSSLAPTPCSLAPVPSSLAPALLSHVLASSIPAPASPNAVPAPSIPMPAPSSPAPSITQPRSYAVQPRARTVQPGPSTIRPGHSSVQPRARPV